MRKFGEIDSADTRAGKSLLVPMGAERKVPRAQTRERRPPSALVEIQHVFIVFSKVDGWIELILFALSQAS